MGMHNKRFRVVLTSFCNINLFLPFVLLYFVFPLCFGQNENSAMWVHGPGSRTMSAVPASTYYSFQGQSQQPSGFRQSQQQPSQNYGALGYPNFYHSQSGISLEQLQQQNPRDGPIGGSQDQQPSRQSQQIWQNSY